MVSAAEGIEDATGRDWLHEAGAQIAQGFLAVRPMPMSDLLDWLNPRLAAESASGGADGSDVVSDNAPSEEVWPWQAQWATDQPARCRIHACGAWIRPRHAGLASLRESALVLFHVRT